ncbi:hypothetical protein JGH11_19140 [Dysgonomonas sp. Marseille-P4677]|uniref:hypothetical protein n=1 Tax=Dysgonomonas sp. Marseille-P4677 TaxID=2364790 RepID=UPI001913E793|nr:hypothetical protein [Dysgonomonas sp. Marseille-P4677]MBK5722988.1 hypothetical protein [Dysgonomonas sp. Marseille-P4677]
MRIIITILLLAIYCTSCIKESLPECPYQYSIQVFVKDKNYSNSAAIGIDFIDENLPFREYVSNLYYILQSLNTGQNIINPVLRTITGDEKEVEIIIDQIPDGEYILTVWGNIEVAGSTVKDPSILHENKEEGADEYIASDTLVVKTGVAQKKSLGLERIKGKLNITFNNLPNNIEQIRERISSVYQKIENKGIYSDETEIEKIFLKTNQTIDRLSTFSAPSIIGKQSTLYLSTYEANTSTPALVISPIGINIARNEITAVTINYNSSLDQLEIWIYIDNEWTLIQVLDIDEI